MLPKMSSHITGNGISNGHGNGSNGLFPPAKAAAPETTGLEPGDAPGNVAVFMTHEGGEARGAILRLSRFAAAFEFYNPAVVLRASEVLDKFRILMDGRTIYSGRAVVGGLIDAGARIICEVKLDDRVTETDLSLPSPAAGPDGEQAYDRFFRQWQKNYRVAPEFKVQVTDIQAFLVAVRQWLEQVEFDLGTRPDSRRSELEMETLDVVARRVIGAFNAQHERFEELAYAIPAEHYGAHQEFVRRQWQPLFLCSPFGQRTFYKPLGYAGDYEMMNMIHRNRPEGGTLYEKLIHFLLVSQWPAQSVRNRIAHLKNHLLLETARVVRSGRRARVLNVGCGPAREVQDFVKETPLANEVDFSLLDFNEETLAYASNQIDRARNQFSQQTGVETRRVSVHHLLRQNAHQVHFGSAPSYDLIYCGGLFDYLSEPTCRALVNLFYDWLRPGGMVIVANMSDSKPFRNFIEFVLDWQLIYRDSGKMLALAPAHARETARVIAEPTSVNLFLHLGKPD
jgi:extracellular factor (EF) 3-hydroxypalmitic acid methyl ester biosynthesis protein